MIDVLLAIALLQDSDAAALVAKVEEEGTVAHQQFPGGARRLASRLLREKATYYEVEFVEPGQRFGVKYHLFYWDGGAWTMLGPVWRLFREE